MTRRSMYDNPLAGTFLLILALVVAFIAYLLLDSHNWPEISGRVTDSYVSTSHVHDHDSGFHAHIYSAVVRYLYLVNNVSYTGQETVKHFDLESSAETYLKEQYWKNQNVRVLYNPNFPNISTLKRAPI